MSWSFGHGSGPGTNPPSSNPYIHLQNPTPSQRNSEASQSTYFPSLGFQSNYTAEFPSLPPATATRSFDPRTNQRPSVAKPSLPSIHQGPHFSATTTPLDYSKRATSSQLQSIDGNSARNSRRRDIRPPDTVFDSRLRSVSQRMPPPVLSGNHFSREIVPPFNQVQRQRPPGPLFDDDIQPVPQRTRSHASFPGNNLSPEKVDHFNGLQRPPGVIFNDHMQSVPESTKSPPQFTGKNRSEDGAGRSSETPSPVLPSPISWGSQRRPTSNFNNTWFGQDQSPQNSKRHVSISRVDAQYPKKTRSPPVTVPFANENFQEDSYFSRQGSLRQFDTPPGSGTGWKDLDNFNESRGSEIPHISKPNANNNDGIKSTNFPAPKGSPLISTSQIFQRNATAQNQSQQPSVSPPGIVNKTNYTNDMYKSLTFGQNNEGKSFKTKPTKVTAPKRNRSPPSLISTEQAQENSSPQDDSEREMQAKAKRLARFRVELSQPVDPTDNMGNQSTGGTPFADMDRDFDNTVTPDKEGPKSTTIITGLCPDMCPVSEREERERKGDLDQYERLDGDRNRTNKTLAVKKYNRTAEREANLIRPMPILKTTIDYLLYLLDQPYDEKFLGLYNFLWDRMRAIRMDLRMQHLFNLDSITMLEQMIRLHIIAMHELCEYTKGEGFSEGFDAHLNIEQMNKTSVELFQLYDDHRKKGINVPTEKEFRGYYALLKLDKHPGYKVEPAELSHDLSKMTPEIRQTQEVLFARNVARACRTGNFIAFFRLARKASYLQACLMHAHFAKLRTQALASLHSGLQNNQGIPVTLIAKWLAIEGEDIESLLEYHGFVIREFDEPFMVKDGQFLNSENDYPLKCSELVHAKKAEMISEDVSSSSPSTMTSYAIDAEDDPVVKSRQEPTPDLFVGCITICPPVELVDEEMNDNEVVPSPKRKTEEKSFLKMSSFGKKTANISSPSWDLSPTVSSPKSPPTSARSKGKSHIFSSAFRNSFEKKSKVNIEAIPMQVMLENSEKEKVESPRNVIATENSVSDMVAEDIIEDKQLTDSSYQNIKLDEIGPAYDEEVAEAKLRLIFRIWKRHSLRRKELREQRQLSAVAALSSLSLGPPIRENVDQPRTSGRLNIDHTADVRYRRHEKSWSSLNVSEIIADTLSGRTSISNCYCWKLVLCSNSQELNSIAVSWLRSKLMPIKKEDDYDLITSLPGLSIWKKWIIDKNDSTPVCCLSVLKEADYDNLSETILGSSAILFLIPEGLSLERERARLHKIVSSLPSGCHLPLLIIIDSYDEKFSSSVVDQLAPNSINKSQVSDYSVIFLKKNQEFEGFDGFLSDEDLRRGLKWLADHSPLPPDILCAKTWDLIGTHLSPSIKVLDEKEAYEVGPDHCILAFNEALNRTLANTVNAANVNRCSWPCPEIDLIDKTSYEYKMASLHLPLRGWSLSKRINQFVSVLEGAKLPVFEDDFSWLYGGSNSRNEIENQRELLENCLIKYLAQTSMTMGISLATNEARLMIQKNAHLELHGSTYYIVPIWVQIFRRIFNWRLMGISTGDSSTTYVLEHDMKILDSDIEKLSLEETSSPNDLIRPSLDEMIDRCTENEVFQPSPLMVSGGSKAVKFTNLGNSVVGKLRFDEDNILEETYTIDITDYRSSETTSEMVVGSKPAKEAGRLSELLEHCSILQDKIDKKLSIYF